jgi:hypothetical protein
MQTLTTILLIITSFSFSAFLIYKGVTGVKKSLKDDKTK